MRNVIIIYFLLFTSSLSAQKELKQQWYLHFKAEIRQGRTEGILQPRVCNDALGNTFMKFYSNSKFEFENGLDTGFCSHLFKFDKYGKLVWSKTVHDGIESDGGGMFGLVPDNNGGVFVSTVLGSFYKLNEDSTFRGSKLSVGLIHWGPKGEFIKLTLLDNVDVGNPEMGLDGNLYVTRDPKTLHVIDLNGNVKTSNFPYYSDFAHHFAANKNGDVASIKAFAPYDEYAIGDSIYKTQKSYGYALVIRDSTGKIKWHRFYNNRGFLDFDDNHSVRWDKNNNLYFALNIISSTPRYEKYVASGQKTILYKFDEYGNQIGEFFDTSQLEFAEHYTQTWLMNDEVGDVIVNLFTYKRNPTFYPGLTIKSEDLSGHMRLKFDENFKISAYYFIHSAPRIDNSNITTKAVFWKVNKIAANQSKEYYLPNGQSVTCKYDSDFFVIMMDTTEPKRNSTAKLVEAQVQVNLEPNPLQLNTTLQVQSKVQPIRSVFVLDVKGNKLKEQLNVNLNKTSLLLDQKNGFKAGVYFVRIEFKNGESTTQKIVVTD